MPAPDLIDLAREARKSAYAPYSGYAVGAAVRGADGRVFVGCNVENISYGLSICAERAAIFSMICDGVREISEIAVATKDGGTPCGACLQVLLEFRPDAAAVRVRCAGDDGQEQVFSLRELIPHGFVSADVVRTEPPVI